MPIKNKRIRTEYNAAYYKKYKKRFRAYEQRKRLENPIKYLLHHARARSKKRNLPFDIEEKDIIIPEICPILLIPLRINTDKPEDNSYSLDKIDNSKGYVKGNVRVISRRANQLKSNMTFEQVERLYKYMKGEL